MNMVRIVMVVNDSIILMVCLGIGIGWILVCGFWEKILIVFIFILNMIWKKVERGCYLRLNWFEFYDCEDRKGII